MTVRRLNPQLKGRVAHGRAVQAICDHDFGLAAVEAIKALEQDPHFQDAEDVLVWALLAVLRKETWV